MEAYAAADLGAAGGLGVACDEAGGPGAAACGVGRAGRGEGVAGRGQPSSCAARWDPRPAHSGPLRRTLGNDALLCVVSKSFRGSKI